MFSNQFKTFCKLLLLGLGFQLSAMHRLERIEKDTVTLKSRDEQVFVIPENLALLSETVKNLIKDVGTDNPIPMPNIDGETLALISGLLPQLKELIDQSQENPFTVSLALRPLVTSTIEKQLMNVSDPEEKRSQFLDQAVRLLLAVNYLDIPAIMDSAAAVVADQIAPADRSVALAFLGATAEEEKDDKYEKTRELLIKQGYSTILTMPRELRSLVMLNLSMLQIIENEDLDAARAFFYNPHFAPGAVVVELFRNLLLARQKAWQDYEVYQYYDYPLPKKKFVEKLLEQATLKGNVNFVTFLSRYKLFDLNEMVDLVLKMHNTPENERYVIVEALLNEGADPNSRKPYLPLLRAFQMSLPRIATLLLARGADSNADTEGFGPLLEYPERQGYVDIAERIRKAMKAK